MKIQIDLGSLCGSLKWICRDDVKMWLVIFLSLFLFIMESFLNIEDPLFLERGDRPTLHCNHYINTSLVLKRGVEKLFVNFASV